jgi:hypothetical protein
MVQWPGGKDLLTKHRTITKYQHVGGTAAASAESVCLSAADCLSV